MYTMFILLGIIDRRAKDANVRLTCRSSNEQLHRSDTVRQYSEGEQPSHRIVTARSELRKAVVPCENKALKFFETILF